MPRRINSAQATPPDWSPEKTYSALQTQLAQLDSFKGKRWREVRGEEQAWSNLTLNILAHGFGHGSNNIKQFQTAHWAGQHRVNMSDGEIQNNYNQRIEALGAMLKGTLAELELILSESPTEMSQPSKNRKSGTELRTYSWCTGTMRPLRVGCTFPREARTGANHLARAAKSRSDGH